VGMKTLTAIVHQGEPDEGGYWATCLEFPGANGQSETREECLANLKEAVQLLLDTECAEPTANPDFTNLEMRKGQQC